jgi:hypothetical protein
MTAFQLASVVVNTWAHFICTIHDRGCIADAAEHVMLCFMGVRESRMLMCVHLLLRYTAHERVYHMTEVGLPGQKAERLPLDGKQQIYGQSVILSANADAFQKTHRSLEWAGQQLFVHCSQCSMQFDQ